MSFRTKKASNFLSRACRVHNFCLILPVRAPLSQSKLLRPFLHDEIHHASALYREECRLDPDTGSVFSFTSPTISIIVRESSDSCSAFFTTHAPPVRHRQHPFETKCPHANPNAQNNLSISVWREICINLQIFARPFTTQIFETNALSPGSYNERQASMLCNLN